MLLTLYSSSLFYTSRFALASVLFVSVACNDVVVDLAKPSPNGVTRVQKLVESPSFQFQDTTRVLCTLGGARPNVLEFDAQQEIYSFQFYATQEDVISISLEGTPSTDTVLLLFKNLEVDRPQAVLIRSSLQTTPRIPPELELVASNDDGAIGGLSALSHSFTENHIYTLIVSSWHGLSVGEIQLVINLTNNNNFRGEDVDMNGVSRNDLCVRMMARCRNIGGMWNSRQQVCIVQNP